MTHDTWQSAAEEALDTIYALVRGNPTIAVEDLRRRLDQFITSLFDRPGGRNQASVNFVNLGADAVELAVNDGFELHRNFVLKTLIKKQRDYGPANISRFGRQGILVRMHDKVARLENLRAQGVNPENESIADTYLDIVGYSAIGFMWERSTFTLPMG